MSELKKCPFCEKEYNTGHSEKCYFRIRGKSDEEREIAWQSRPIEVALLSRAEKAEAKVKELREELDKDNSYFEDIYTALEMEDFAPSCIPEINKLKGRNFELEQSVIELESSLAALREQMRWRDILKPPDIGIDVEVLSRNGSVGIDRLAKRINEWTEQEEIDWEGVGGLYTHWRPIDLPETDKEVKE